MANLYQYFYHCIPQSPFPDLDPDFHKPSYSSDAASGGGEDRINALPDDLLRRIFSCLRVKDAGRAAATSPRWRHIWRSTPCALEDRHLIRQLDLQDGVDWTALAAAVSRVLLAHPGPFRWVHLTWNFMGSQEEALANWLRLFAAKGVENLVLVNRPWPLDMALPASILRCSALRRLYIGVWHFPDTSRRTVPPRGPDVFPHLQELGICHTIMDERDLDYLLACSPQLKILSFNVSYGFPSRLEISSRSLCCMLLWFSMAEELAMVDTPRLQRLIIYTPGAGQTLRVKIGHAPQLTVLGYLETAAHVLEIGNTIITVSPSNFMLSHILINLDAYAGLICCDFN
jgi:hypothetical protein